MNQTYLFYYLGIGLLVILIFAIFFISWRLRKKERTKGQEFTDYIRALNYLIDGNLSQAIEYFHNSVRQNTENIDAYLKLGDIFRQQNKIDKALKIHKELLVRRNLSHLTKSEITRSLVLDYYKARNYEKALEYLNSIFAVEPKNIWAKHQQLTIYEAKGDWENAFKTLKFLSKWESRNNINEQLSLYKVEESKQKFKAGIEKDGRILLREAIKIDPTCSAAYIELGDSYVRESRFTDAINVWSEFVRKVPNQAYLVFERLQEVLYSMGSYSEIENILQELHHDYPEILEIIFMLADLRIRKGDIDGAIGLCKSALEKDPNSTIAKMKLVKLYDRKGQKEDALKIAVDVADKSTEFSREFLCSVCDYQSKNPLWFCPKCQSWKSFNI